MENNFAGIKTCSLSYPGAGVRYNFCLPLVIGILYPRGEKNNTLVQRRRTDNTLAQRRRTNKTLAQRRTDRQYNRIITQKTKDQAARTPLQTGDEIMWSERVNSSCSTSDTSCVTRKFVFFINIFHLI